VKGRRKRMVTRDVTNRDLAIRGFLTFGWQSGMYASENELYPIINIVRTRRMADANISLVDGTHVRVQEGADDRDAAAHPAHEGHFGVEEDHRRYDDDHAL
jgi:hypothetical protein